MGRPSAKSPIQQHWSKIHDTALDYASDLSFCKRTHSLAFFTDKELRLIDNELIAPSYFIVASLAGFTFIGCISKIITKLKFLSHSLAYVGRHTLIILFTHIIVFKIVGLLQIYFYELNISEISNYPICYKDRFSWIYYTIAGMGLPLLYEFIGNKAALYNERRKQSKTCSE